MINKLKRYLFTIKLIICFFILFELKNSLNGAEKFNMKLRITETKDNKIYYNDITLNNSL